MKLKRYNYKIVNSTNELAIRIINNTNDKLGIIIAEKQKNGKGQYGKRWISYKGNLFVSIFFPINKIKLSLKQLTFVNCVLIKKFLMKFYNGKISIKKPNDLLIENKKISGILQETIFKSGIKFIIIGIGVNLIKNPNFKNYPTTNVLDLTNIKVDSHSASLVLKKIYEEFIPLLGKLNIRNINRI